MNEISEIGGDGHLHVGNEHILRRGGVVSHKRDHSGFSEILLRREKNGGGEGGEREEIKATTMDSPKYREIGDGL